jgi:tRNA (mo5U34)-methyltransferase
MEGRGAKVTAIDVENWLDFDLLPWVREDRPNGKTESCFSIAHAMRGSTVERKVCSVYDLSPEIGTFDVVFCGSLLLHLQNPLKALVNIRSVTKERAIIVTALSEEIEHLAPDKPWAAFGSRQPDLAVRNVKPQLGANCIYWCFNTRGLQEIMEYAGFARTEPRKPVPLPPTEVRCAVVVGYP